MLSRQRQTLSWGGDKKQLALGTKMAELPKDFDPYGELVFLFLFKRCFFCKYFRR